MKKNGVLIAVLLLFATQAAFSQTSKIAHRSHSGKNKTFNPMGEDHLGLPSHPHPKQIKQNDTVVANHLLTPPKQDSTQTKPVKRGNKAKPQKATATPPKKAPVKPQEKRTKSL